MSLSIITSATPPVEPVTVDEVKARLRLTTTADDVQIAQHITSAREFAEKVTGKSLVYRSYVYTRDRFWDYHPRQPLEILPAPVLSVTSVQFYDDTFTLQTWDPAEYRTAYLNAVDFPTLLVPAQGIVYPPVARVPGAVMIGFNAGYGYPGDGTIPPGPPCPQHLCEGIRKLALHLYEHPESVTSEGLKEAPTGYTALFTANKLFTF
jgi:uncharacterized phiE125 gp8 family phage protein